MTSFGSDKTKITVNQSRVILAITEKGLKCTAHHYFSATHQDKIYVTLCIRDTEQKKRCRVPLLWKNADLKNPCNKMS
jgi:hypothetical protein